MRLIFNTFDHKDEFEVGTTSRKENKTEVLEKFKKTHGDRLKEYKEKYDYVQRLHKELSEELRTLKKEFKEFSEAEYPEYYI